MQYFYSGRFLRNWQVHNWCGFIFTFSLWSFMKNQTKTTIATLLAPFIGQLNSVPHWLYYNYYIINNEWYYNRKTKKYSLKIINYYHIKELTFHIKFFFNCLNLSQYSSILLQNYRGKEFLEIRTSELSKTLPSPMARVQLCLIFTKPSPPPIFGRP